MYSLKLVQHSIELNVGLLRRVMIAINNNYCNWPLNISWPKDTGNIHFANDFNFVNKINF